MLVFRVHVITNTYLSRALPFFLGSSSTGGGGSWAQKSAVLNARMSSMHARACACYIRCMCVCVCVCARGCSLSQDPGWLDEGPDGSLDAQLHPSGSRPRAMPLRSPTQNVRSEKRLYAVAPPRPRAGAEAHPRQWRWPLRRVDTI